MIALNPTLQGAVSKAERGIAFLRIPQATSDHLRSAMDHFKSAAALAQSHRTVLVELEGELPAPGPALFDEAGAPSTAAALAQDDLGLRIDEHPVLTMGVQAYVDAPWNGREPLEEELLFALRLHARARRLDYKALRDMLMDDLGGFDEATYAWTIEQILTSGDFVWPHKCEDCECNDTPDKTGQVLCWSCKNKRQRAEESSKKKEAKKAAKASTPKAPKKPRNPLGPDPAPEGEEAGDE